MSHHLDIDTRQICLIRFSKDHSTTSALRNHWLFDTIHVSIDSKALPPYTALSYVWGPYDERNKYKISIHESILEITPNLHGALSTIEKLEDLSGQWLWIDATCIDQSDLDERAAQVKLMRDLYSRADRTVAYLGPEDDGAEIALSWIEQLGAAYPNLDQIDWFTKAAVGSQYDLEWNSLNSLFGRQWWLRAWILQETILSSQMYFLFGKKMIQDKLVVNAMLVLRSIAERNGTALSEKGVWMDGQSHAFRSIYKRFHLRYWYQERQRLSLGSIVSQRYHFYATDPRDYVFALFSLVERTGNILANANYKLTVWQVYATLVKSYTEVYGNLDIICLATSARRIEGLPSWAPDLSFHNEPGVTFVHEDSLWLMSLDARESLNQEQTREMTALRNVSRPLSEAKVTYGASGSTLIHVSFSENLKTLTSKAVYIDAIGGIAGYPHLISNDVSVPRGLVSFTMFNVQPLHEISAYGTPEATRDAIWRSILFDRIPESETRPAPDYAAAVLTHACISVEAGKGNPTWAVVWQAMRDFRIAGASLHDWICDGIDLTTAEHRIGEALKVHLEHEETGIESKLYTSVINSCASKLLELQRHLFVTQEGYIGTAPLDTERGDEVWILYGCNIPVLLRKLDSGRWRFVGECYIHGYMYGEVVEELRMGRRQESTVVLT
jgi:Heterokaryon incompatibility protein (HET)